MIGFVVHLLVSALCFVIVSRIVPGWRVKNYATACVVALVYYVLLRLALVFKLVALFASLPFVILLPASVVFGLVSFMISLGVILATDKLVDGFEIDKLSTAVVGAVVLSIVQSVLHWML